MYRRSDKSKRSPTDDTVLVKEGPGYLDLEIRYKRPPVKQTNVLYNNDPAYHDAVQALVKNTFRIRLRHVTPEDRVVYFTDGKLVPL